MEFDGHTHDVVLDVDGEYHERSGVVYAEEATRARDGEEGVAILYPNFDPEFQDEDYQEREFVVDATLVGTYAHGVYPDDDEKRPDWLKD